MPFSNGPDVEGRRPCAQEQDCHTYSETRVSESQHEVLHASLYIHKVLSTTLQKRRVKKVQVYIYIYTYISIYILYIIHISSTNCWVACRIVRGLHHLEPWACELWPTEHKQLHA